MKHLNLVVVFLLLLSTTSVSAQQSQFARAFAKSLGAQETRVEQTGESKIRIPGEIFLRTFHTIGDTKKITFQVIESKNIDNGNTLCFGRLIYGNTLAGQVSMAVLTLEDVDKSIKLITTAQNLLLNKESEIMEDLEYINDTGYLLAISKLSGKWNIRISSNCFDDSNTMYISASNANDVKGLFEAMKDKMTELSNN